MNTMQPESISKRRRWPLVLGGVLLFLVLVVALAPSMLSGFVGSKVSDTFAAEREGKLEIGALSLGWTGRQKLENVRLVAPDGSEVARVSVELPSLLDLASGGGAKVGKVVVNASASLVADDAGVTNLDRALALRKEAEKPKDSGADKESGDLGELLAKLALELEVRVERAQWSDARTRAAGTPFAVENLVALVTLKPGQPVLAKVNGKLSGEAPGSIAVDATVREPLAGSGVNPKLQFEVAAQLDALPSAFIDALAQQPGMLATAFGPQFRVKADAKGTLEAGTLALDVAGPRGSVVFQGALAGGILGRDEPATLQVALKPEAVELRRLLANFVPPELTLEASSAPQVDLALTGLRVNVQQVLEVATKGGDVASAAIGASEFELRASTQGWKAAGALVPLESGVSLDGIRVEVKLAPQEAARTLTAQFETQLGAGASGFVSAQARIDDLAKFLASGPAKLIEATKGDEPPFDVTLNVQQVQPATLAAFAPKEIDVGELLGRALDVRVDVTNRRGRREAQVRATSPTLAVDLAAWMEQGALVSASDQPWTIRFTPPEGALGRAAQPLVPESLGVVPGKSVVVKVAPGLRVPVMSLGAEKDVALALLRGTTAKLEVEIDALDVTDTNGRKVDLRTLQIGAVLAQGADKAPLAVTFGAKLASQPSASISIKAGIPQAGALDGLTNLFAIPAMDVELVAEDLPLALADGVATGPDSLAARLGKLADVALHAKVLQKGSEPLAANVVLDAKFEKAQLGVLADAKVTDPFELKGARAPGTLPPLEAKVRATGLRSLQAFLPAEFAETVVELTGDTLDADVAVRTASADDLTLTATVAAERISAKAGFGLAKGQLTLQGAPIEVVVRATPAILQRHAGASLPAGAALVFVDAEPALRVGVTALDVPIGRMQAAEGKEPASLGEVLRDSVAKVLVELPALEYTQPPLKAGASATKVELRDMAIEANLASGKPATVDVKGKVGGAQAGQIALHAVAADIGGFVERVEGAPMPAVSVAGGLAGFPTALIDSIAAQDGLLVDVLGPLVEANLSGAYPSSTDPLTAELRSANASLKLVARMDEGLIVAVDQQGLDASLPLSPLFSKRVIGNLVPLMVNASKPEGASPVGLRVRQFQLPLDGDLRKVNGTVELDLGQISYEFLPGLASSLDSFGVGEFARKTTNLKPLSIPIKNGIAGYTALPVSINGVEYPFTGTYDLAKGEMKFAATLPLSVLGKSLTKELDKVRDYVDPNLLVPIEIGGAWNKPSVGLGSGFVEKVLKDAAGGALKNGLDDLFGKKKDKKKD